MILGSMLPATDFDVLEYHLEGPKDYYQAGRISYLPHNVYTNMPFGVEMLHLLGMQVMADWWWGALAGQLLVALFTPLRSRHADRLDGRSRTSGPRCRLDSPRCVFLSTPWIYAAMAVIAYVEERPALSSTQRRCTGLGSGSPARNADTLDALEANLGDARHPGWQAPWPGKYTGLISAVIPFGLLGLRPHPFVVAHSHHCSPMPWDGPS